MIGHGALEASRWWFEFHSFEGDEHRMPAHSSRCEGGALSGHDGQSDRDGSGRGSAYQHDQRHARGWEQGW